MVVEAMLPPANSRLRYHYMLQFIKYITWFEPLSSVDGENNLEMKWKLPHVSSVEFVLLIQLSYELLQMNSTLA
jgi:hypothetical protein